MIIPENDPCRRLPIILQPEQRLRIEALIQSADMLDLGLDTIREMAEKYGPHEVQLVVSDRTRIFSSCWMIVDQIHNIRLILNSLLGGDPGPEQSAFLKKYESARIIRNKLDHLDQNIGNIARSEGQDGIFGSFGFFYANNWNVATREDGSFVRGYLNFLSSTSAGQKTKSSGVRISTDNHSSGVMALTFYAFGSTIDLDQVTTDVRNILDPIREDLNSLVAIELSKLQHEQGIHKLELVPPPMYVRVELSWPNTLREL